MSRKIVLLAAAVLTFAGIAAFDLQRRLHYEPHAVVSAPEPFTEPKPDSFTVQKRDSSAVPKAEHSAISKLDSMRTIRIEVLNGCGVAGIAEKAGRYLREAGFDVMTWKNADSFNYPETIVIDRTGNIENARSVASAMGLQTHIQQIVHDPYRIEQVAVIIGRDYDRLGIFSGDRPRR
ncbi:MAG: LytR C-terminal domain-containing protein [Candidatus Latescibacteria bacterium]|nr:LytR C-terminal domain-containing protein [Candidatus Latescibacterota bacterium]